MKRRPARKYPKIPPSFTDDERTAADKELSKGSVRPEGPGDETAPVEEDANRGR